MLFRLVMEGENLVLSWEADSVQVLRKGLVVAIANVIIIII